MNAIKPAINRTDLLDYLKWNSIGRKGRLPLLRSAEIDVTTKCATTPGCAANCTYRSAHSLNYQLTLTQAEPLLRQMYDLGISELTFSGGGEPLHPLFLDNGLNIIDLAARIGFNNHLLTYGLTLSEDILPRLLPSLKTLRVSISPVTRGFSHLGTVIPNITKALAYRASFPAETPLDVVIIASLLIRPDTPLTEIDTDVKVLDGIGVDRIRFKPTQFPFGDSFFLPIGNYRAITKHIASLGHPKVVISKISQLATTPNTDHAFCYYADFQLVIGANRQRYACCDSKYRLPLLGGAQTVQSEAEAVDSSLATPFAITQFCFEGCKGDLANRLLHRLTEGYQQFGDDLFEHENYAQIADAALIAITRSDPTT